MKNNIITQAALLGITAAAVLVLSVRSQVGVDSIVGFGSIAMLLGVMAMEYRITWKSALGR
jgi:F0F1-type ATP synthase assembly protein I